MVAASFSLRITYYREVFIRRIFAKRPFQGARVFILVVLSLVLFFCDRNLTCFTVLRTNFLPFITAPLSRVINWPIDLVQTFSGNLASKQLLLKENAGLRLELLLTNAKLQRLGFLEQENFQLRTLLNSSQQLKTKFLVAQLLVFAAGGLDQQITIDKGKMDGLYVGQPVVDAYGLFGQVISIGSKVSKILRITDAKSAVPVMIVRNGIQVIAIGTGRGDSLELINAPETIDIKEGDFLVTSGMGQRFPAGYAVGSVKMIKHILGERFIKVLITPSARVNSSQNVLLLWTGLAVPLKHDKK
ncbi:Cell shape-determining protein MreC [Gammaproteobacteria bacterium]